MNRNKYSVLSTTVSLIVVALFIVTPTCGQEMGGGMGMGGGGMGGMGMGMPMTPLDKLKDQLRSTKGDVAQKKVLGKIQSLLSKQYDLFLQQNEAELQEMEKSVKALRTQLERRKSAKVQLLKLEVQRISNEASGLVWPDEPDPMSGMGMGGMQGGMGMGMGGSGRSSNMELAVAAPPFIPEFLEDEEPDTETLNQLRKITLAALNFDSPNMHLPGNINDEGGKPLLSWRVAILQFMDEPEKTLYSKFKLNEPWNSEHNLELLDQMPDVYKSESFDSETKTLFLGFDGKGAMFESGKKLGFADITDGSSNTIFAAQMNRQSAVPWTKPADIPFEVGTKVTQLAETQNGRIRAALCDGSVQEISIEELDDNLENLIQRNDGNTIRLSKR